MLKDQALKRNGIYHPGFLFRRPSLELAVGQMKASVYFEAKRKPGTVNFECALPLSNERDVYIGPQKYGLISITPGKGMQDILVGDERFDKSFIIQSKGLDVQNLLSGTLRNQLLDVYKLLPSVYIDKNKLLFRLNEIPHNERDLSMFIDAGIEILRQIPRG